ncbi:NAD(P)/FAD-dependent oxidoreductase [Halobacillus sp. BAB-2008]|uniref:dihydrolipoyl dehydrogenase family protein n=1 Tax=Halobacillus sp. BAB-2008 TaxID=1246484 RepID=UPI000587B907|nr:NAD(P)/FAD-dependent oxidoreductase [Halobacillus sp. BAB-2008]
MDATYNLIVIGSGAAGRKAATEAQQYGWKTAVVESGPLGGTCPNRGCDPKRILSGITETYDDAHRLKDYGIQGALSLDWNQMKKFKDTFTVPVPAQVEHSFREIGMEVYKGTAIFIDGSTIEVGDCVLKADHFLIATGSLPAPLPFEGTEHLLTSDDFFEQEYLPDTIVFVGGGPVSFELAHMCRRMGRNVSIFHDAAHILEEYDIEMTNKLVELSRNIGINVHTNAQVTNITRTDREGFIVEAEKDGLTHKFNTDLVIHGGGRVPNIQSLHLERAGIDPTDKGIPVDANFKSASDSSIYAAGDAADSGLPPLTPAASLGASRALSHMLEDKDHSAFDPVIPSVVFTYPKLAKTGLSQQEAEEQGVPYEILSKEITPFFSYQRTRSTGAFIKVLTSPGTDEILGAHLLSDHADHLINLFTVAIKKNMTKQELSQILWAYPSEESDIPSFFQ